MNLPGDLTQNISDCPTGLHVVEFVSIKTQVLFHSRYKCIIDIDLIFECQKMIRHSIHERSRYYLIEIFDAVSERCQSLDTC